MVALGAMVPPGSQKSLVGGPGLQGLDQCHQALSAQLLHL